VHIAGASKKYIIQENICQCIDSFKPEKHAVILPSLLLCHEGIGKGEVIVHQRQNLQLIISVIGIRNIASRKKGTVNRARYLYRNAFLGNQSAVLSLYF